MYVSAPRCVSSLQSSRVGFSSEAEEGGALSPKIKTKKNLQNFCFSFRQFESTQDQSDTDLLHVIKAHHHRQTFTASTTGIFQGILRRIHLGVTDRGLFYRPIHTVKTALQKRRRASSSFRVEVNGRRSRAIKRTIIWIIDRRQEPDLRKLFGGPSGET
jgi:hypothetical protein